MPFWMNFYSRHWYLLHLSPQFSCLPIAQLIDLLVYQLASFTTGQLALRKSVWSLGAGA